LTKHKFPEEIYIAYAVCRNCNNNEFIVDGQTQICNNCKELLFRTDERIYVLNKKDIQQGKKDILSKNEIVFPEKILVGYATCSTAANGEEVVIKDQVICQQCEEQMVIEDTAMYFYSNKTYKCPICGYEGLYFPPDNSYETCPNCEFDFTSYNDEGAINEYKEKWDKKQNEQN